MSITHNKNLNSLLNLLITYISARSAPQILPIKGEYIFPLSKFLIIDLFNSFANCLFEIFSFLIPLPEEFLQKNYKPLKEVHLDIHHILDFLTILNALSRNTLSAAFLLFKSLKSP